MCCASILVGLSGGCKTPDADTVLAATTERLKSAYDDLAAGAFEILADLETPDQQALFRIEGPEPLGEVELSTRRNYPRTGAGSLRAELLTDRHVLVIDNANATRWVLSRDWEGYHLLLLSVYSPRPIGPVRLAVHGGPDWPLPYARANLRLQAGWNVLRIDLADVAERIDLSDVRQVRLSAAGIDRPVELYLDNLVLADNTRAVFGTPDGPPGSLYVLHQGRRLHVGSVERFELVFSGGRIRRWYDTSGDAMRIANLVGDGPLGPSLVIVPAQRTRGTPAVGLDDLHQWAALGPLVTNRQGLLEANHQRVMVVVERTFSRPPASQPAEAPHPARPGADPPPSPERHVHRWQYTIRRTGHMAVRVEADVEAERFTPADIGLVVCTARDVRFEALHHPANLPGVGPAEQKLCFALHRRKAPGRSDLLAVLSRPTMGPRLANLITPDDPRVGSVFYGGQHDGPVRRWVLMMTVWPADLDSLDVAAKLAADYCMPAVIRMHVGQMVATDPGDDDNDGFNESEGCYVMALDPEAKIARFTLPGRSLRFQPQFKLLDTADRLCWVYADGKPVYQDARTVDPTRRDRDGNVLFSLDRIVDRPVTVEINTAPAPTARPTTQPRSRWRFWE